MEGNARNERSAEPLSQFSHCAERGAIDVIARLDLKRYHGAVVSIDDLVHFVVVACTPMPRGRGPVEPRCLGCLSDKGNPPAVPRSMWSV